jgi:hypothetical protein
MPKTARKRIDMKIKTKESLAHRKASRPPLKLREVRVERRMRSEDHPLKETNVIFPKRLSFIKMALALAETFTADGVSNRELKNKANLHLPLLTMLFTTKSTLSLHDRSSLFYVYFKSIVSTDANVAACIDFASVLPSARAIRMAIAWDRFLSRKDKSIEFDRFVDCVLCTSGNLAEEIDKVDPGNFEEYKDGKTEMSELVVYIERRIPMPNGLLSRNVFHRILDFKPQK